MNRGLAAAAVLAVLPVVAARAGDRLDLNGLVDVRAVATDASASYLDGGYGRTRFDDDHAGLRLGRLMLSGRFRLTDTVTLTAVAESYGDGDRMPVGLSAAYAEWRPFPTRPVRFKLKAGAFYPPVSLEHRQIGWTSPYTLSTSALNTWVGEEFRVIGTELEARWLGASQGYDGDVAVVGGVYGWNDGAGTFVAERGWALTDRPTLLLGTLGRSRDNVYTELDGKPGYYAGLSWRHGDSLEVRALHYDNRADPGAHNQRMEFGWETRFTSVGVRYEPTEHVTLMAQHLEGKTYVGPDSAGPYQFEMRLQAWFGLASYERGSHRWSVRFDHFATRQDRGFFDEDYNSDDAGHALTFAWFERLDEHWELVAEWLRVQSRFGPRLDLPLPPNVTDRQVQLAVRYRFRVEAGTLPN
jgi:hypothetical protein